MKKTIIIAVITFVVGYLLADYLAMHFAKTHGVKKYGGIFKN